MNSDDDGFTARWSRRKTAARQEKLPPDHDQKLASLGEQEVAGDAESPEAELLTEEDFADVDFEALDKSSDYTRFIQANVPAAIQQKALRKLWNSDSVFEVLDGMNDYDEDFTGKGLAGKVIKTAYKVGKGFLHEENVDIVDSDPVADSKAAIVKESQNKDDPDQENSVETLMDEREKT